MALIQCGSVRRREVLAAAVSEVRFGRAEVVPVGLCLDAGSLDGDELALDADQRLDHALGLLVAALAEVMVSDQAVAIDEIERRPVMVAESAPDRIVAVHRDGVVDRSHLGRVSDAVDVVLERELRRVHSDDHQPVAPIGLRPRTDVGLLTQPVDARQGPEVDEDHMAAQVGGAERFRVDPTGRPVQQGHVLACEHDDLPSSLINEAVCCARQHPGPLTGLRLLRW